MRTLSVEEIEMVDGGNAAAIGFGIAEGAAIGALGGPVGAVAGAAVGGLAAAITGLFVD